MEEIKTEFSGAKKNGSAAYVPSFQLTKGQPPPIAANGGLSYMSFDRDGRCGNCRSDGGGASIRLPRGRAGGYRHARQRSSRPDPDQVGRRVS